MTTTMTAADRCDRCGARACLSATLTSGVLLFCAHHARENHDALTKAGAIISVDNTDADPAPLRAFADALDVTLTDTPDD